MAGGVPTWGEIYRDDNQKELMESIKKLALRFMISPGAIVNWLNAKTESKVLDAKVRPLWDAYLKGSK